MPLKVTGTLQIDRKDWQAILRLAASCPTGSVSEMDLQKEILDHIVILNSATGVNIYDYK